MVPSLNAPQIQPESSSNSKEDSDSDSEASNSESNEYSDSADSEEIASQRKVHVQPLDRSCLLTRICQIRIGMESRGILSPRQANNGFRARSSWV